MQREQNLVELELSEEPLPEKAKEAPKYLHRELRDRRELLEEVREKLAELQKASLSEPPDL